MSVLGAALLLIATVDGWSIGWILVGGAISLAAGTVGERRRALRAGARKEQRQGTAERR